MKTIFTLFFIRPHKIDACEGRVFAERYFRTPLDTGTLESSRCSEMSRKSRQPISLVVRNRFSKAELVMASKCAMPVITTFGFSFFINSIIKSDWRGASITVRASSTSSLFATFCRGTCNRKGIRITYLTTRITCEKVLLLKLHLQSCFYNSCRNKFLLDMFMQIISILPFFMQSYRCASQKFSKTIIWSQI